jgi:hypothetical protein
VRGPGKRSLWTSNTAGQAEVWDVVMQSDGNLVLYDVRGHALWASNTNRHPGASVRMQDDGNLVISSASGQPLWSSDSAVPPSPAEPAQPDRLAAGEGLGPGDSITSRNRLFSLVLNSDGSLLVHGFEWERLWSPALPEHADVWDVVMSGDGNLVQYDVHGRVLWASNTAGHPGACVVMQDDGNLVVRTSSGEPIWASNTVVPPWPPLPTQWDRLASGQGLRPGDAIQSQDGRFSLVLQRDGNLVVQGLESQTLWASNTGGRFDAWDVVMQDDGNLVVHDVHGRVLWASFTDGHPGASAVMQSDGNLVISTDSGQELWASDTVVP